MTPKRETIWQKHAGSIIAGAIPTLFVVLSWYATQVRTEETIKTIAENQKVIMRWKEVHTLNESTHMLSNYVDLCNLATEIKMLGGRDVDITARPPREPVEQSRRAQ